MPELVALSHLKDWLSITDTQSDTFLTTLLNRAEAMIESWCNRPAGWITATFTERFDGECHGRVVLLNTPVTSITSVKVFTDNSTATTLSSTVYRSDSTTGILSFIDAANELYDVGYDWPIFPAAFPSGFRNGQVIYVGGYASSAIPLDLQQIAVDVASELYRMRGASRSLKSETLGQYSYTRADDMGTFTSVKEQLHSLGYVRRPVIGGGG